MRSASACCACSVSAGAGAGCCWQRLLSLHDRRLAVEEALAHLRRLRDECRLALRRYLALRVHAGERLSQPLVALFQCRLAADDVGQALVQDAAGLFEPQIELAPGGRKAGLALQVAVAWPVLAPVLVGDARGVVEGARIERPAAVQRRGPSHFLENCLSRRLGHRASV